MATNSGIITEVFPLNERGRALGAVGAFVSLGAIAGPGIGGLILSNFSWSYIFWINVPVGLVTILIGEKFLPKDITKQKKNRFFRICLYCHCDYDVLRRDFPRTRERVWLVTILFIVHYCSNRIRIIYNG